MSDSIPLHWKGQLVGHILDPDCDNYHLAGRWVSANGLLSSQFIAAVEQAIAAWDENGAGVDVYLDSNSKMVVEVTSFEDGKIEILMNPGRWS